MGSLDLEYLSTSRLQLCKRDKVVRLVVVGAKLILGLCFKFGAFSSPVVQLLSQTRKDMRQTIPLVNYCEHLQAVQLLNF
jgi:hypothetical protein